ncbi:MAG: DUF4388 domain-containing protein [bacterium]
MNARTINRWTVLILLLAGSLSSHAKTSAADSASGSGTNAVTGTNVASVATSELPSLVVEAENLWIPIEDLQLTFDVGKQLALFQQNDNCYVAIVLYEDDPPGLCAVPRVYARDQGTAWVTNEKYLFFGVRTRSCDGRFYFIRGEKLPVVFETRKLYRVQVERYGRVVELELPKSIPHVTYVPAPSSADVVAAEKPKPPPAMPARPARPSATTGDTNEPIALSTKPPPRLLDDTIPSLSMTDDDEASMETVFAGMATGTFDAAALDSPSVVDVATTPQTFKDKVTAAVYRNIWLLELLLALAILAAIPVIIKRNSAALLQRRPAVSPPPFQPASEQVAAVEAQITKESNDEFAGSLDTFTMGDLIQFVHSTTKTGMLDIQCEGLAAPNHLVFELGEIIDAACDGKRGEDAVYAICRIKKGSYTFSKETRDGVTKTVNKATMSLLLDAHRVMDEEGGAENKPEASPAPGSAPKTKKPKTKLSMK